MSEPVQTCQLCGRSVTVRHDGRGFPPDIAERKLRKICKANGCNCEPSYTAGASFPPPRFNENELGTAVMRIECDGCGVVLRHIFAPGSKWAIEIAKAEDNPRAAVMAAKGFYSEKGWLVSWGKDFCPDCKVLFG